MGTTLAQEIIRKASIVFNVTEIQIIEGRTERCTTLRYMIWYYLHCERNETVLSVSRQFHSAPRTVHYGISKIREGIQHQKFYQTIYESFINDVVTPIIQKLHGVTTSNV